MLNASAVHTGVLQGSNTDTASVARSMHIDALGILSLGSLFELLGIPLTSLSLDDLGTLASSLGVVVEGLPGGSTLAGFTAPLLDTLGALLGDQAATVGSLTAPVQGVLTTLIGSTPASDTEVGELPVPTLLSDLVTQITDLLTGLLGDLSGMPLIQLNAIDLSAAASAVGTLEGSSADAGCTLGSVQIGALPAIDLSAVTTAIGQVGTVLDQLPFGLGDLLELSVCGQSILGAVPQTVVESVAMAGQAVEARSSASAVHFGIEPGAVLTGLVGGTPLESLFGQAGGLSLPELPAIPGLVDLSPLVGSGNVMAEGMDLDVGRVSARATYQATPVAIPAAPTPAPDDADRPAVDRRRRRAPAAGGRAPAAAGVARPAIRPRPLAEHIRLSRRPTPSDGLAVEGSAVQGVRPVKAISRVCSSASAGTSTFGAVVAARAEHLVHGLHADEHVVHRLGVERLVEAGGAGEVPGVHDDVAQEEHADGVVEPVGAGPRDG